MTLSLPTLSPFSLFFILTTFSSGLGRSGDMTEQALYLRLMHNYQKDVRPTPHHSLPTNVTFGCLLQTVVDVDEKNQVLTTRVWLNINWMDTRLAWNVSLYKGIRTMHVPHKRLWKPDVMLANNADPEYQESVVSTDIFIAPNGNVTWLASAIFRSSCQMRVRYYPFDDQECNMSFASWSHNGDEINLILLTSDGDLSNYVNNSEFSLISFQASRMMMRYSCCPDNLWPVVTFSIRLQRRPLFYVFNHILPCVLISSMAILGFYVPPDTGEKVTMCITTMLSMGVYLKTITEIIPPTSEAVPLIGVYYVVSLFVVCLATVVNVWTLNLHNRGLSNKAAPVPNWIKRWVLGYLATALCITIHQPDTEKTALHVITESEEDPDPVNYFKKEKKRSRTRNKKSRIDTECELQNLRKAEDQVPNSIHKSSCPPAMIRPEVHISIHGPREGRSVPFHTSTGSSPLSKSPFEHRRTSPTPRLSPGISAYRGGSVIPRTRKDQNSDLFAAVRAEFENRFQRILRKVYRTIEQNEMRQAVQEERTRIMWEWKQLAEIVDRLLLWLFLAAILLTTFFILFKPAVLRDPSQDIFLV